MYLVEKDDSYIPHQRRTALEARSKQPHIFRNAKLSLRLLVEQPGWSKEPSTNPAISFRLLQEGQRCQVWANLFPNHPPNAKLAPPEGNSSPLHKTQNPKIQVLGPTRLLSTKSGCVLNYHIMFSSAFFSFNHEAMLLRPFFLHVGRKHHVYRRVRWISSVVRFRAHSYQRR